MKPQPNASSAFVQFAIVTAILGVVLFFVWRPAPAFDSLSKVTGAYDGMSVNTPVRAGYQSPGDSEGGSTIYIYLRGHQGAYCLQDNGGYTAVLRNKVRPGDFMTLWVKMPSPGREAAIWQIADDQEIVIVYSQIVSNSQSIAQKALLDIVVVYVLICVALANGAKRQREQAPS